MDIPYCELISAYGNIESLIHDAHDVPTSRQTEGIAARVRSGEVELSNRLSPAGGFLFLAISQSAISSQLKTLWWKLGF